MPVDAALAHLQDCLSWRVARGGVSAKAGRGRAPMLTCSGCHVKSKSVGCAMNCSTNSGGHDVPASVMLGLFHGIIGHTDVLFWAWCV